MPIRVTICVELGKVAGYRETHHVMMMMRMVRMIRMVMMTHTHTILPY